jgi:pyruvate,water dikinase
MTDKWIFWFEEIGQGHNELVGKKCANLGEMTKIGMPVPHGFSLSIKAQEKFMRETNAEREIRQFLSKFEWQEHGLKQYEEASRGLRQIIETKEIPQDMRETIMSHYDLLCQRCGPEVAVSVRSAGTESHPGQYETYLNVRKGELLYRILKVWSSIYNTRTIAALDHKSLPVENSSFIGVAVVEMVNACCAGVGFTCDPVSGDPSKIVIEGNWGLGESVVSGATIPDKYVLNKYTLKIKERAIGDKQMQVVATGEGTEQQKTPPDKRLIPCLSDEEVVKIAELAKVLEVRFGVPQDIEWAISADLPFPKNVFLLQTRPVAGIKAKATTSSTAHMIDEMKEKLFGL